MDRNDYYGGESTSLSLVQVIGFHFIKDLLLDKMHTWHFFPTKWDIVIHSLSLSLMYYSSGRDSEAMINLQNYWVQAGSTMWI